MKSPDDYTTDSKLVFKLKTSLHGLKQSPRCWNRCITYYITEVGFKQSKVDPCLFIEKEVKIKLF